jgi:CBS domain containing-hemolysin-like protein
VTGVPSWQWAVLGLGLLSCAFFAAAETALTSLGEARVNSLIEEGTLRGRLLRVWRDRPEGVLAALLMGSTLVNIGLGSLTALMAVELGWGEMLAAVAGGTTVVVLVFGEITPKTFAKRYARTVALALIPLVALTYFLFRPFVAVFVSFPRLLERVLGIDHTPEAVTSQELEYLIEQGARVGNFDEQKERLLSSVLAFTEMQVKAIMVPRTQVVALDEAATYEEALKLVIDSELSRIPVYRETMDQVVGVLQAKRLLGDVKRGADPARFRLAQNVTAPFFVPDVMKVSRLLAEMQKRKTHLAIVVDEFGGTAGIVTLEDVMEEIVGEIHDESDVEERKLKILPDGGVLADGQASIRELEEHLGVELPEGDFDTVGGFLTSVAGRVPPAGSLVVWGGLSFTVRTADERRVLKVEIGRKGAGQSAPPPAGGSAALAPGKTAPPGALPPVAGPTVV